MEGALDRLSGYPTTEEDVLRRPNRRVHEHNQRLLSPDPNGTISLVADYSGSLSPMGFSDQTVGSSADPAGEACAACEDDGTCSDGVGDTFHPTTTVKFCKRHAEPVPAGHFV
jgi:hypothetical protein